jgi:NADH-quinone oxidoreductase subunit L
VDEIYNATIVNPMIQGSKMVYKNFDLKVIDGTANGSAKAVGFIGKVFSNFQTGLLKDYALIFLLGAIILLGYLLF